MAQKFFKWLTCMEHIVWLEVAGLEVLRVCEGWWVMWRTRALLSTTVDYKHYPTSPLLASFQKGQKQNTDTISAAQSANMGRSDSKYEEETVWISHQSPNSDYRERVKGGLRVSPTKHPRWRWRNTGDGHSNDALVSICQNSGQNKEFGGIH